MSEDYIVRGMAADQQLRVFAITGKHLVERARQIHQTSPVATAALGRLLLAGSMMGCMMKGEQDILTLQIQCGGPIGGLTVTADHQGRVKGYVREPQVDLPLNPKGKLDVSGALGPGFLNVIRDIGMKEPYNGQTHLVSGEIAEDLTYYYATSEQIPSSVGLGVLVDREAQVRQAGGFIIQVMPFAEETVIDQLEASLQQTDSITDLMEQGMRPEDVLQHLLGSLDLEITDQINTPQYYCNCSRERVFKAIASIGRKDLEEMVTDREPIEVNCQFCGSHYLFETEDLEQLLQ